MVKPQDAPACGVHAAFFESKGGPGKAGKTRWRRWEGEGHRRTPPPKFSVSLSGESVTGFF